MASRATLLLTVDPIPHHDLAWQEPAETLIGSALGSRPMRGVEALLLAVLDDGIRCFFSSNRRIRQEASTWVEDQREQGPFSFVGLCEYFRLDPWAVRAALRTLHQRRAHLHAHIRPRGRRAGTIRALHRVAAERTSPQRRKRRSAARITSESVAASSD